MLEAVQSVSFLWNVIFLVLRGRLDGGSAVLAGWEGAWRNDQLYWFVSS